jgi:hypothetical protein
MIELPTFMHELIVESLMTNVKKDLELIGKWAEINIDKKHKDIERDKDIIEAIKRVDSAAEILLKLGISHEDISKLFKIKPKK